MISYYFNQSNNYLETKIEGPTNLTEIVELAKNTLGSKSYPRELKVLDDERNAEYLFTTEDLNKIWDAVLENIDNFTSIKHALLADSPKETAITYLFSQMASKNKKYKLNVFSTPAKAIDWLLH